MFIKYNDFLEIVVKLSIIISFPIKGYESLELDNNERFLNPYFYKFESFCINCVKLASLETY